MTNQVMARPYAEVARRVRADPGRWWLVAAGGPERRSVFSTTTTRIMHGRLQAFVPDGDGSWEAHTFGAEAEGKEHPVELYLRWLPTGWTPPVDDTPVLYSER